MKDSIPKAFLTTEETAAYLGIAKITLYTYTSKHILTYYKSRRKLYFKISDLDDFVLNDNNRVKSKSEIENESKKYDLSRK